jgi:proteic killer suppression protein
MILRIKHKGLKRLYHKGDATAFNADHVKRLRLILQWLDAAGQPEDLDLPGLALHQLKGARRGIWSVTVAGPYRVTWKVGQDGGFIDIDYEDYH